MTAAVDLISGQLKFYPSNLESLWDAGFTRYHRHSSGNNNGFLIPGMAWRGRRLPLTFITLIKASKKKMYKMKNAPMWHLFFSPCEKQCQAGFFLFFIIVIWVQNSAEDDVLKLILSSLVASDVPFDGRLALLRTASFLLTMIYSAGQSVHLHVFSCRTRHYRQSRSEGYVTCTWPLKRKENKPQNFQMMVGESQRADLCSESLTGRTNVWHFLDWPHHANYTFHQSS